MASDGNNGSVFSFDSAGTGDTPVVDPAALAGDPGNGSGDSGSGGADDGDGWLRDEFGNIRTGPSGRRLRVPGWRKSRREGGSAGGQSTQKKVPLSVGVAEGILVSVHMMLSAAAKSPELVLEDKEAKELASAIVEVEKHYSRSVFDPKIAAWINLSMVAGAVYVPRVVNIRTRLAEEAKARREQGDSNIISHVPLRA